MSENTTEVVAGGLVLAAAAAFLVYAAQFAGVRAPGSGDYQLTASFRSVEGVNVGTDVRLAGVKVGRVSGLALNQETYRADATFTIDGTLQLPDDSAVVVSSEGLLGGNFIELLPGGSLSYFEPGDEIEDTQSSVSIISLLLKFVSGDGGEQ